MQLSLSVNISDITIQKKNVFERFIMRPYIFSKEDLKSTIISMKEAGISGLELVLLNNTTAADIAYVKEFSTQNNLPIYSLHQPVMNFLNMSKDDVSKYFHFGQVLGVRVIVIHIGAIIDQLLYSDFIAYIKSLQKKYQILVGIENIPHMPINYLNTATYKTREFSTLLAQAGLSITFDTTHLAQAGGNINDFYTINKQLIINIHLSNYAQGIIGKQHTIITEGILDLRNFLHVLKNTSYDNLLTLEINDSLSNIIRSLKEVQILNYLT